MTAKRAQNGKKYAGLCVALLFHGTILAGGFSAEDGLRKAREDALAPRADRVVHRVLQQNLAMRAHAGDLLVAAVAGREPRCHDDQRSMH